MPAPPPFIWKSPSSGPGPATARVSSGPGAPPTARTGRHPIPPPTPSTASSRLKYALYRQALKQVFDAVRADNARTGRQTRCYVATHSLINYAHWGIVSPESSLLAVGADGFIAQVWTGTARTPNVYEGVLRERTFETAFLEYGAMVAATRGSQGRLWFLHDPVEDDPNHSWEDYRTNWECTVVASLLWPEVARYEVAPWPERVFHGSYPTVDRKHRKPGEPVKREPIKQAYATELLTVMNALNDMDQPEIDWDCGTRGIGIVVSDTMMFQRADPDPSDPHLGSFFGLALPLLERGMPVEPVQLETAATPGSLARFKVLVMTYEGMKPMDAGANQAIADWVKAGGALVFVDDDRDPYNAVKSWWNQAGLARSPHAPRGALLAAGTGTRDEARLLPPRQGHPGLRRVQSRGAVVSPGRRDAGPGAGAPGLRRGGDRVSRDQPHRPPPRPVCDRRGPGRSRVRREPTRSAVRSSTSSIRNSRS